MALKGVERKIVLDYLADNDVPIAVKSASGKFKIDLEKSQYDIVEQKILVLKEEIENLPLEKLRIQFFYNKRSLFFESFPQKSSAGIAFVIGDEISKTEDSEKNRTTDFYATVCFDAHIADCNFSSDFNLFEKPEWAEISEKNLENAKKYIESLAPPSQSDVNYLPRMIRICRYLFDDFPTTEISSPIENRIHNPEIIYASSFGLVFASKKGSMILSADRQYEIVLHFPIKGPLKERKVHVTCETENVFESHDCTKLCVEGKFTCIKEEDARFLKDAFHS